MAEIVSSLLNKLDSVEDLTIVNCNFDESYFAIMMNSILPRLKNCRINNLQLRENNSMKVTVDSNQNFPLKSFTFKGDCLKAFEIFTNCNQIESLEVTMLGEGSCYDSWDFINPFLAQQKYLKKLSLNFNLYFCCEDSIVNYAWVDFKFRSLVDLDMNRAHLHLPEATHFLSQQKNLKSLRILLPNFRNDQIRNLATELEYHDELYKLLKTICGLPKLTDLTINVHKLANFHPEFFRGLVSKTVIRLRLRKLPYIAQFLIKMFPNANSIDIYARNCYVDLGILPHEMLSKITGIVTVKPKLISFVYDPLFYYYKSNHDFEESIKGFLLGFANNIVSVKIGRIEWSTNSNVILSNNFCKFIIDRLPLLKRLELYNLESLSGLHAYIAQGRNNIESASLYEICCCTIPVKRNESVLSASDRN